MDRISRDVDAAGESDRPSSTCKLISGRLQPFVMAMSGADALKARNATLTHYLKVVSTACLVDTPH